MIVNSNEKNDDILSLLPQVTISDAAVAHCDDGADGMELVSLTVDAEATELKRFGKNLFSLDNYIWTSQTFINLQGKAAASNFYHATLNFIPFDRFAGMKLSIAGFTSGNIPSIAFYSDENEDSFISSVYSGGNDRYYIDGFTVPSESKYARFCMANSMVSRPHSLVVGSKADQNAAYTVETFILTNGVPDRPVTTLLGDNTFIPDVGNISMTYRADIPITIQNLKDAIVSLGGNI